MYLNFQNTLNCGNNYLRGPTNDLFHKLTTNKLPEVTTSRCDSNIIKTFVSFLNTLRSFIDSSVNADQSIYDTPKQTYLEQINIHAGTYYVVLEGINKNKVIKITIGITPKEMPNNT